jgi:hypothetical protein
MPECRGAGFVYLKAQKVKCWVSCTFIEMRWDSSSLNWTDAFEFWWLEPYCLDCRLLIREPTVSLRRFLFTHKPKMERFLFDWYSCELKWRLPSHVELIHWRKTYHASHKLTFSIIRTLNWTYVMMKFLMLRVFTMSINRNH